MWPNGCCSWAIYIAVHCRPHIVGGAASATLSYHNLHTSLRYVVKRWCSKIVNYIVRTKGGLVLFIGYISDNFASDLVIFGMLHRNVPNMQVGNYIFTCLIGNAVLSGPTWITLSSQQRFVVCELVCRLAVDILNIIFSHALFICRLVD